MLFNDISLFVSLYMYVYMYVYLFVFNIDVHICQCLYTFFMKTNVNLELSCIINPSIIFHFINDRTLFHY